VAEGWGIRQSGGMTEEEPEEQPADQPASH